MVSQDQMTSRIERMGRATLRKTQAIEDDDHIPSAQTASDSVQNSLTVPNHNLPHSKKSSFEDDDTFKQPSNHLSLNSVGHFPAQPPMLPSVALALNNTSMNPLNEAAIQLLIQQRQLNKDTCKFKFLF